MLRPNTIKERNILARLQKPGDALVLGAMLFRDGGGSLEVAAITDLGGVRVTLKQKRLGSGATPTHEDRHEKQRFTPTSHAVEATLPRSDGKRGEASDYSATAPIKVSMSSTGWSKEGAGRSPALGGR